MLPFLEGPLSFQKLDCEALTPVLGRISDNWERLITEDDRQAGTDAMAELSELADQHIYFRSLYVRWYDRFLRMGIYDDCGNAGDPQMLGLGACRSNSRGTRSKYSDSLI